MTRLFFVKKNLFLELWNKCPWISKIISQKNQKLHLKDKFPPKKIQKNRTFNIQKCNILKWFQNTSKNPWSLVTSVLINEYHCEFTRTHEKPYFYLSGSSGVPSPPLPPTNTIENNPIVSKNLTKRTNSTEDKFQPRKVDSLRVAQWIFSTYQPFPNDRVRNDPPTREFFWKYYSKITRDILSHVTGYFSQIMSRLIFDVTG